MLVMIAWAKAGLLARAMKAAIATAARQKR